MSTLAIIPARLAASRLPRKPLRLLAGVPLVVRVWQRVVALDVANRCLIATDSEMKKVNWTSKKELIGSTKVVIFFMLLIMLLLFAFDTIFGYFFQFIRVLKFGPFG